MFWRFDVNNQHFYTKFPVTKVNLSQVKLKLVWVSKELELTEFGKDDSKLYFVLVSRELKLTEFEFAELYHVSGHQDLVLNSQSIDAKRRACLVPHCNKDNSFYQPCILTLNKLENLFILFLSLALLDKIYLVLKDYYMLKLHYFNGCQMFWSLGLRTRFISSLDERNKEHSTLT